MGLGGISAESMFDDISYDDLSTKLNKLKSRYVEGNIPNLKERKQRLKKLIDIVENNADAIGDAIQSDFGTRHKQLSLMADVRSLSLIHI